MKTPFVKIIVLLISVALIGTFSSCKKDNPGPVTADPTPTLTFAAGPYTCAAGVSSSCSWAATSSIPTGGPITYTVSPTTIATINTATGAITPVSAGTATVTATQAAKNGVNAVGTATYSLTITGLSITSFSPAIGGVGYSVTITGTDFDLTASNNIVTICGVATAVPTAVSATSLTVLVPKGASGPGNITVSVGSQLATKGTFTEYATVTTLAGDGTQGYKDDTGIKAQFWYPVGVVIDNSGNLLVADVDNNVIRSVNTTTGVVTTLAGDGSYGSTDAQGISASFHTPYGLAINKRTGTVYVSDKGSDLIRAISTSGNVTTYAGTDEGTDDGGALTDAEFYQPQGLVVDAFDNVFVTDRWYSLIREITAAGNVITLSGNGTSDYVNGSGTNAAFYFPDGMAIAPDGNSIYIADATNNAIRNLSIQGSVVASTFAGTSSTGTASGFTDATGTAARFNSPSGLVFDAAGNLYVTDSGNGTIRRITPAGVVTTICGDPNSSDMYKDGLGPNAHLYAPAGITIDADGNLYVTDGTQRIRKIVP